jgi:hypothetical protein
MTTNIRHGTKSGYTQGCRDTCCRTANNEYMRQWRETVRNRPVPRHVHGTLNGQKNYGCTCDACREADNQHARRVAAGLPADWTW